MHEIKVQVLGCNRDSTRACRCFLVDAVARFLERGLDSGSFDPTCWQTKFDQEQRRTRTTLLLSSEVKHHLETLRLRIQGLLLREHRLEKYSLADIIEMGIVCMEQEGFLLEEEGSLLRACETVELEPYAVTS